MRKLLFVAGVGLGYVLGTRAGRERYDQMADQASRLWGDPRVQEKVETVKSNAPGMASKVAEGAKHRAGQVKDKVSGSHDSGLTSEHTTTSSSIAGTSPSADTDSSTTTLGGDRLP